MNLYLISQTDNTDYDSYDEAVVAAESLHNAGLIHPSGGKSWDAYTWCYDPQDVNVEYIGVAKDNTKAGVICASFNAG